MKLLSPITRIRLSLLGWRMRCRYRTLRLRCSLRWNRFYWNRQVNVAESLVEQIGEALVEANKSAAQAKRMAHVTTLVISICTDEYRSEEFRKAA